MSFLFSVMDNFLNNILFQHLHRLCQFSEILLRNGVAKFVVDKKMWGTDTSYPTFFYVPTYY